MGEGARGGIPAEPLCAQMPALDSPGPLGLKGAEEPMRCPQCCSDAPWPAARLGSLALPPRDGKGRTMNIFIFKSFYTEKVEGEPKPTLQ